MTRSSLRRTLRHSYWVLGLVLALSLITKLAGHIPGLAGGPLETLARDVYDYLKDMALVFVTVVAAYLASVFQKRHNFVEALRKEWHDIIKAKSALFAFTQIEAPTQKDYVTAFCAISESIDNMRSVYKNVGETGSLVGYYPYEPLHDMRRALQTLEPRKNPTLSEGRRTEARKAILESWYALREQFLEELELEPPDNPLLVPKSRRTKAQGATRRAIGRLQAQGKAQKALPAAETEIDAAIGQEPVPAGTRG
jgi:hypothetical protein